jgi:hypothetical protein
VCRNKWNAGQLEKQRNIGGKQTDHIFNRLGGILMQFFNIVIFIALAERITRPKCKTPNTDGVGCSKWHSRNNKVVGAVIFELAVAFIIGMLIVQHIARSWGAQLRRFVSITAGALFVVMFVLYASVFGDNASSGFVDIVLLSFANFTLGTIVVQLVLYIAPYNELGVLIVNAGYYAADTVIGLVTFLFIFLLAIFPLTDSIQALLLFNKDVLEASRAGRQLEKFQTRTGSAGAAALGGGGGGRGGGGKAAAPAPAPERPPQNIPVAPAADPRAVLPPAWMDTSINTYGTNMAASIMGGVVRGVFAPGSSSRRRQSYFSESAPQGRPAQPHGSGSHPPSAQGGLHSAPTYIPGGGPGI